MVTIQIIVIVMYGKNFKSMYTGSMRGAGMNVFAVWNYIIANTFTGVVELNPEIVAFLLGGSCEEVQAAIDYLCKPDPKSRTKAEEGRRLVKEGEYQYRVVNWLTYRTIRNAEDLKAYNRSKQAVCRAKKAMNGPLKQSGTARSRSALERERRAVKADDDGQPQKAEAIAAEGLP